MRVCVCLCVSMVDRTRGARWTEEDKEDNDEKGWRRQIIMYLYAKASGRRVCGGLFFLCLFFGRWSLYFSFVRWVGRHTYLVEQDCMA